LAILRHRRGRHRDDRDRRGGRPGAQLPQRLDTVDAGQVDVHQDQRGVLLARQPDAVLPRVGLEHAVALDGEHVAYQLAVLLVVLDDQDQLACHGLTGIVNVKVDPCSSWLLTQIVPPWRSTNLRARARPNPVSATEISTKPSASTARTSMRPPSGVNFTAFDKRFTSTCLILRSS